MSRIIFLILALNSQGFNEAFINFSHNSHRVFFRIRSWNVNHVKIHDANSQERLILLV